MTRAYHNNHLIIMCKSTMTGQTTKIHTANNTTLARNPLNSCAVGPTDIGHDERPPINRHLNESENTPLNWAGRTSGGTREVTDCVQKASEVKIPNYCFYCSIWGLNKATNCLSVLMSSSCPTSLECLLLSHYEESSLLVVHVVTCKPLRKSKK